MTIFKRHKTFRQPFKGSFQWNPFNVFMREEDLKMLMSRKWKAITWTSKDGDVIYSDGLMEALIELGNLQHYSLVEHPSYNHEVVMFSEKNIRLVMEKNNVCET